ncbi:MAG: hypothetical protein KJ771_08050 [Nanoarchaeota archaeon]|nr:hypothetical protein [Nanoarchaeota archaeon]
MDERYLRWFWKKYIDKNLYRVVSEEYLKDIKRHGIDPDKDPYHKQIPLIKKLFSLLLKLEEDGFGHTRMWGNQIVDAKKIIAVSTKDIENPYVDFTASYRKTYYYRKHRGGALVITVKEITSDILEKKPSLSKSELKLVNDLHEWAVFKSSFRNRVLFFKGSSRYFETAHFQMLGSGKDYIESPFGRYEHFKQIVEKNEIDIYKPYLEDKDTFYLRSVIKIPASEIIKIL